MKKQIIQIGSWLAIVNIKIETITRDNKPKKVKRAYISYFYEEDGRIREFVGNWPLDQNHLLHVILEKARKYVESKNAIMWSY